MDPLLFQSCKRDGDLLLFIVCFYYKVRVLNFFQFLFDEPTFLGFFGGGERLSNSEIGKGFFRLFGFG